MKILIIEDNIKLLEAISEVLSAEQFLCVTADRFDSAYEKLLLYSYDILIVDINLPDGSGLDLIRAIKKHNPSTGIIVISARNSLDNKIEGLELGADDYLTKPFDMAELIARVKSLFRRCNFLGTDTVTFSDITIDVTSRTAWLSNTRIDLTKSEFEILLFFFSNPGRVLTRACIAEHIWGDNMDLVDSFDFIYSHIKNLRKKVSACGGKDIIKAVYGIGYKLETNNK
ncbi:MAG TPA: response regulator transcription factor [Chitinispirillaceae bacterium]|nr:response regulator transcription factor [Chitinispirillaceae bacterium]